MVLLAAAPVVAFYVLRMREMSPAGLPDPTMHSVYLWDPGDLIRRYTPSVLSPKLRHYIGPPAAYFRWGARPGFLVPGRLAYLAFGPVPGFIALRYVLALIAIVPTYQFGKRCYGVPVGVLGVCLVLASPVVITTWGTDFPSASAISYLIGGLACLLTPARSELGRRGRLLVAVVLFSLGVWSLATTGPLVLIAALVVLAHTARTRGWRVTAVDLVVLAGGAIATTVALAVASWLVLGRFDFVVPTLKAVQFLSTPAQTPLWHSHNGGWVFYDAYLLVLPATCLAWAVLAARRRLPVPALLIGVIASLQLVVAAVGQFAGTWQLLEEHYLSAPMWAGSLLALMVVIAELSGSLLRGSRTRWLPAALVIAVALIDGIAPRIPGLSWDPWGVVLALVVVVAAAVAWLPRRRAAAEVLGGLALLCAVMVLTVAPSQHHGHLQGTVYDPPTSYAGAFGGRSGRLVDDYRLEAAVRRAVPDASYRGEQLVDCLQTRNTLGDNLTALFHTAVNYLPGPCSDLGAGARRTIRRRDVAQLVAMAPHGGLDVDAVLARLAGLHPRVTRLTELRSGVASVELAIIDFPSAAGPHRRP